MLLREKRLYFDPLRLIFLLSVTVGFSKVVAESEAQLSSCTNENEIPIGTRRVCSVENYQYKTVRGSRARLLWYETECGPRVKHVQLFHSCHGYVGMTLTLQCSMSGAYICKNGELEIDKQRRNSSVIFSSLQPEHAGEYECRYESNDTLIYNFNVTVNAGI